MVLDNPRMPNDNADLNAQNQKALIRSLKKGFDSVSVDGDADDLLLRQCASESWFSDALAWLLDPKGSHGLGKSFADAFLHCVAECRSKPGRLEYAQGEGYLKARKHDLGRGVRQFNLGNAAIIREFFIADLPEATRRSRGYCDVVLLDLDEKDGIILVVENKLFTTNSKDQLSDYYKAVQTRYGRVTTREFVYLTLFGTDPVGDENDKARRDLEWVRLSWCRDLLPILRRIVVGKTVCAEVARLVKILEWVERTSGEATHDADRLPAALLEAGVQCIHRALQARCKHGSWKFKGRRNQSSARTLYHSINPTRLLHVRLLPNLTVVVAGERCKSRLIPKVIIPFGAHPRQVKNLIALVAEEIYAGDYFRNSDLYHCDPEKTSAALEELWPDVAALFEFTHRYAAQIQVLMAAMKCWSLDTDEDERTAAEALADAGDEGREDLLHPVTC